MRRLRIDSPMTTAAKAIRANQFRKSVCKIGFKVIDVI
jgi:CRISPR/Cas system-associated protein endoribonuclease Cas2